MNAETRPLRLAIISGEESGDLLGADLVRAIRARTDRPVELVGVGGTHLSSLGIDSIFDPSAIAITGMTAVARDLPRLLGLISRTASKVARMRPDCVVTIDSPAFNLRVARRIRAIDPSIPIVKYVCPSVWAWLPRRAAKMREFTDHVLCLLPFEPAELKRLGGPPGTYVGHRLSHHSGVASARTAQHSRAGEATATKTLLLLPGSRRGEVKSLIGPYFETVDLLVRRGNEFKLVIPTIPRLEQMIRDVQPALRVTPQIITGEREKWQAFGTADAALATSGTVLLELALAGVPMISCYKLDPLMRVVFPKLVRTWSAALPNLIADQPIVPECYDYMIRPSWLARMIETLWHEGPARAAQLERFSIVKKRLHTKRPAGENAADVVLSVIGEKTARAD